MSGIDLVTVLGIAFGAAVGVAALAACVALVVIAIRQILRAPIAEVAKLGWVVVIIAAPLLGAMAWFAFGHRTADIERYLTGIRAGTMPH